MKTSLRTFSHRAGLIGLLILSLALAAPQRAAQASPPRADCGQWVILFDAGAGGFRPFFQGDGDCDGIPDSTDNCPYATNSDQRRTNPSKYGDACIPENGYRITARSSEVAVYRATGGGLEFYSVDGKKLGEASSAGLVTMDASLALKQIAGWTYQVSYVSADGKTHTTRFKATGLNFGLLDVTTIAVDPATVEMKPGETRQFSARGFHATGIELWFLPRWSATGGTITTKGLYTAGATPGDYTVTACRVGQVCGMAAVKITQ